jgi:hypothetical protein
MLKKELVQLNLGGDLKIRQVQHRGRSVVVFSGPLGFDLVNLGKSIAY